MERSPCRTCKYRFALISAAYPGGPGFGIDPCIQKAPPIVPAGGAFCTFCSVFVYASGRSLSSGAHLEADNLFIHPFRLKTISVMPSLTSSSWDRMK